MVSFGPFRHLHVPAFPPLSSNLRGISGLSTNPRALCRASDSPPAARTPAPALVGETGLGKSTFINSVFGADIFTLMPYPESGKPPQKRREETATPTHVPARPPARAASPHLFAALRTSRTHQPTGYGEGASPMAHTAIALFRPLAPTPPPLLITLRSAFRRKSCTDHRSKHLARACARTLAPPSPCF